MAEAPEYVVIGHVTRDLDEHGGWREGGTATYAALTAARLGLRVGVLTAAKPGRISLEDEARIELVRRPSATATTFENVYLDGRREQYIRAVAESLTPAQLPTAWGRTRIAHLGPIAQEVAFDFLYAFPGALLGVTPQGWLRAWDDVGRVYPVACSQEDAVLRRADVIVLSLEDLGNDRRWLARLASRASLLVETRGADGAVVFLGGVGTHVPAFWAAEQDPTGAGDVFAAAFLARFSETRDPLDAARFANAVASFVVEAPGAANLPSMQGARE
ncbi:MAG: PfkB family carbohydrate kinase, partial [Anaerolineae bacterium]